MRGEHAGTRPMICVSGGGAGWDSLREQEKLEARKMLENAAESRQSGARCVSRHGTIQVSILHRHTSITFFYLA